MAASTVIVVDDAGKMTTVNLSAEGTQVLLNVVERMDERTLTGEYGYSQQAVDEVQQVYGAVHQAHRL